MRASKSFQVKVRILSSRDARAIFSFSNASASGTGAPVCNMR